MRNTKRRTRRGGGQVTHSIVYRGRNHDPHDTRSIMVRVPTTEVIDTRRAAGIVALRTGTALDDVRIVSINTA